MLDLFAGFGVRAGDLTFTDGDGNNDASRFRRAMPINALKRRLYATLVDATERKLNVIIRPRAAPPVFLQLDDLDSFAVARVRPIAFMVIETSPRNHQAWLAFAEPINAEFASRLRQGLGADRSASGATRLAGSFNFKAKYAPDYPRVSIVDASPARVTTEAEIEALRLPSPEAERQVVRAASRRNRGIYGTKSWPSYSRCLEGAPVTRSGTSRDVSVCDFTWCLIALDWGWSIEATAGRLMTESPKARSEGARYAERTAERAAIALADNRAGRFGPKP